MIAVIKITTVFEVVAVRFIAVVVSRIAAICITTRSVTVPVVSGSYVSEIVYWWVSIITLLLIAIGGIVRFKVILL